MPSRTRTVKFHNTHSLRDVVRNACSRHAVRRPATRDAQSIGRIRFRLSVTSPAELFSNFGKSIFCERDFRKCSIKNRFGRPWGHHDSRLSLSFHFVFHLFREPSAVSKIPKKSKLLISENDVFRVFGVFHDIRPGFTVRPKTMDTSSNHGLRHNENKTRNVRKNLYFYRPN